MRNVFSREGILAAILLVVLAAWLIDRIRLERRLKLINNAASFLQSRIAETKKAESTSQRAKVSEEWKRGHSDSSN